MIINRDPQKNIINNEENLRVYVLYMWWLNTNQDFRDLPKHILNDGAT